MDYNIIHTIQNTILLLIFIFVVYSAWQYWITSYVRQRIFEVRNFLFLQAADKKIDFNSNEYIIIRNFLNGSIRFAHKLTWFDISLYVFLFSRFNSQKKVLENEEIDVNAEIEKITDNELKKAIKEKMNDIALLLVLSIYLRSPLLIFLSTLIIPAIFIIRFFKKLSIKEHTINIIEKAIEKDMQINPA